MIAWEKRNKTSICFTVRQTLQRADNASKTNNIPSTQTGEKESFI